MWSLVLLSMVSSTSCLKVMSFERSLSSPTSPLSSPTSPLSFATLSSGQQGDLGDTLVLCWSHQQGAWDQRGIFHMYGDEYQVS